MYKKCLKHRSNDGHIKSKNWGDLGKVVWDMVCDEVVSLYVQYKMYTEENSNMISYLSQQWYSTQ